MEPPRKAVLYVRVSTQGQEDGYSLDDQEDAGRRYAERKGLAIVKTWRGSESAWKEDRWAFQELVGYVRGQPAVSAIIFAMVDRMTRNLPDIDHILKLVQRDDKEVHLVHSGRVITKDSTPDDFFMLGMEALIAKRYSDEISFKVKRALRQKAAQGHYPSVAPLGYLNNPQTKLIDLDPERAPLIKRLWELRASGNHSLRHLEAIGYQEGLRTRKGKRFHHANLELMFKNPFYYGEYVWHGQRYHGAHPPLITQHLFEQVQQVAKQGNIPKMVRRNFAFAGLLTCGQCGCAITSEMKKRRYIYYHCTHSKGNCEQPSIVEERLDEKLLGVVRRIQLAPTCITASWPPCGERRASSTSTARRSLPACRRGETRCSDGLTSCTRTSWTVRSTRTFGKRSTTNGCRRKPRPNGRSTATDSLTASPWTPASKSSNSRNACIPCTLSNRGMTGAECCGLYFRTAPSLT